MNRRAPLTDAECAGLEFILEYGEGDGIRFRERRTPQP